MTIDDLDAAAARAESDPAAALALLPWLTRSLADDSANGRFAAWGRSSAIDENVGGPVVPEPIFDELHARAGLTASWPVGNAGLLHVYGYLLSRTPTPYGLKRERWLTGELAEACGLARDGLSPWGHSDTLLARATAAARVLLSRDDVQHERVGECRAVIAVGDPTPAGTAALAYALDGRIVTLFPVADPEAVGRDLGAPRLRWNAAP